MTATLRPSSGYLSSHAVVWMTLPAKSVTPGMSGTFGCERKPVAVIRNRADSTSPSASVTFQVLASSSQRAPSTTVLNRMCPRMSNLSATSSAYCLISAPVENSRDQFGLGSKKYEYVVVGTSTASPG